MTDGVLQTPVRAAEFKSAYGPKYVPDVSNDADLDEGTELRAEMACRVA